MSSFSEPEEIRVRSECFGGKQSWTPPVLALVAGVVEGDLAAIEAYKSSGGDIARQLTADEVRLLNRPSAFDVGYTLVHLAIRFQRQDMLALLLTEVSAMFWIGVFFLCWEKMFFSCHFNVINKLFDFHHIVFKCFWFLKEIYFWYLHSWVGMFLILTTPFEPIVLKDIFKQNSLLHIWVIILEKRNRGVWVIKVSNALFLHSGENIKYILIQS